VVLCAHLDTAMNTAGAADNAGGVACLLALAEEHDLELKGCGLEFVAFNGEEYLPMGDDEYLRRAKDYFEDIRLAVNLDGVGLALGTTSVTILAASEEQQALVKEVAGKFSGVVWTEPWPESNHSTFAMRNIPAVAITSEGERRVAHHPHDDLAGMSAGRLQEAISLVKEMLGTFPDQAFCPT